MKIDRLIVSGGGGENTMLLKWLIQYFNDCEVIRSEKLGLPVDAKEAICFAVLANETIHSHAGNIPKVTGAVAASVLGKICL